MSCDEGRMKDPLIMDGMRKEQGFIMDGMRKGSKIGFQWDIWQVDLACSVFMYFTVLYCTVLYCTVLYCTVLYCTVLYCTVNPTPKYIYRFIDVPLLPIVIFGPGGSGLRGRHERKPGGGQQQRQQLPHLRPDGGGRGLAGSRAREAVIN